MTLETIRNIPFKEKKQLVAEACLMFKKLKGVKTVIENKQTAMRLSDSIIIDKKQTMKSVSIFETILSLLETQQAMIIKNDFIDKVNAHWYQEYLSKTNYYQLKHEAIDQFLYLMYA